MPDSVRLESSLQAVTANPEQATPIGKLVTEIIMNCLKYAFPGGRPRTISASLAKCDKKVTLKICDDGVGLPGGFDAGQSKGMGLKLVKGLSAQLDGSFAIRSTAAGTCSTLEFSQSAPIR